MITVILLIFAFVLCVLQSFWPWWSQPRSVPHLGWLGMALYFLSIILGSHV